MFLRRKKCVLFKKFITVPHLYKVTNDHIKTVQLRILDILDSLLAALNSFKKTTTVVSRGVFTAKHL